MLTPNKLRVQYPHHRVPRIDDPTTTTTIMTSRRAYAWSSGRRTCQSKLIARCGCCKGVWNPSSAWISFEILRTYTFQETMKTPEHAMKTAERSQTIAIGGSSVRLQARIHSGTNETTGTRLLEQESTTSRIQQENTRNEKTI